jgi:hypothetical protein
MEEYKIIDGFEKYSVSNLGNVRNNKSNNLVSQISDKDGYLRLGLYDVKNIRSQQRVHRLVAIAFIDNPDNKTLIDHIDRNVKNNNINNLRWATNQENCRNRKLDCRNKLGFKGIVYRKKKNKYEANINGKYIGLFETIEEAIKARQLKSDELFNNFQNDCEKEININIKLNKMKTVKLNINFDAEEPIDV